MEQDLARSAWPAAMVRWCGAGHWRNFLAKYSESNRMHKKMLALSALCRRKGRSPAAGGHRRAQCNDAYWHGVFGGLYLPHLREAIWRNLAIAEQELRHDEELSWEVLDFDGDGHQEIWIHSNQFSAVVSPGAAARWRSTPCLPGASILPVPDPTTRSIPRSGFAAGGGTGLRRRARQREYSRYRRGHPAGYPSPTRRRRSGVVRGADRIGQYESRGVRSRRLPPAGLLGAQRLRVYRLTCRRSGGKLTAMPRAASSGQTAPFRRRRSVVGEVCVGSDVGDQAARFTTELSLFGPLEIDSSPEAETWRFSIDTSPNRSGDWIALVRGNRSPCVGQSRSARPKSIFCWRPPPRPPPKLSAGRRRTARRNPPISPTLHVGIDCRRLPGVRVFPKAGIPARFGGSELMSTNTF